MTSPTEPSDGQEIDSDRSILDDVTGQCQGVTSLRGKPMSAALRVRAPSSVHTAVSSFFDGDLEADGVADTWIDLAALNIVLHPFDLIQDGPAVAAITTQLRRRHATDSTYIRLAQHSRARTSATSYGNTAGACSFSPDSTQPSR